MSDTKIEWATKVWNVLRGCSRVSRGCENCYAERVAARFSDPGMTFHQIARRRSNGEPQWTGKIEFVESKLLEPLKWRKPQRVFVNSMSDVFHEKVTDEMIDMIFAVMALAPEHTFLVLTKRPARMLAYMTERFQKRTDMNAGPVDRHGKVLEAVESLVFGPDTINFFKGDRWWTPAGGCIAFAQPWPLPNVQLIVSAEDQATYDERVPLLKETPAAVRGVSAEPLLGPIDTGAGRGIDWIIVGGESGPNARPCDLAWIEEILIDSAFDGPRVFVKQLGSVPMIRESEWRGIIERTGRVPVLSATNVKRVPDGFVALKLGHSKGGNPEEWPERFRVREFPMTVEASV